jgi:hypothetical protein
VASLWHFVAGTPASQYLLYAEDASSFTTLAVTLPPKPEAQTISGRVANLAGTPPKDAIIWADSGLNTPVASANTAPDGTYTLPLPPGTYVLSAEWFGDLCSQRMDQATFTWATRP